MMNTIMFEMLEERQLLSGHSKAKAIAEQVRSGASALVAQLKNVVASIVNASKASDAGNKPIDLSKEIARLKANAELMGASKAALAKAIKQLQGGREDNVEQANRLIVVDALKLPAEALRTKLSAAELLEHVADLQTAGGQDKQSDVAYWQDVRFSGPEVALGKVVAANLGIPDAVAKGKKAKDLVSDAANIQLLTGDVRSKKAWDGLALLKQGKISVEDYAGKFTDGKDIGKSQPGNNANSGNVQKSSAKSGFMNSIVQVVSDVAGTFGKTVNQTGGGAPSQAGSNVGQQVSPGGAGTVTNTAPATNDPAPVDVSGAYTATIGNVNNSNGTSTYGITYHYPDGSDVSATVTVNSDGSATVVYENGYTETYPPGSYDQMPGDASGQTIAINQDTNGDGQADEGTYYPDQGNSNGDDHDSDDDDDKKDDQQSDTGTTDTQSGSTDNSNGGASGSGTQGTPNPENFSGDPRKAKEFYGNNPIGKQQAGKLLDPVKSSRGGGAADPTENPDNPQGRSSFNKSKLGAKNGTPLKIPGGNIDYADDHTSGYIMLDKRLLESIRIRSGGAVGGPDAGRKPKTGTTTINPKKGSTPVTPNPKPGTTAVFSTVAISAKSLSSSQLSAKVKVAAATALARAT